MGSGIPRFHNWGSDVEAALSVVLVAEENTFARLAEPPPPREFLKIHRWLLAVDAIPRFLRARPETGALGRMLAADRLAQALARGARFIGWTGNLASRADAILFKSNSRAFYPSRGMTLKTSNPARIASRARIAHEAAARRRLVPGRFMRAPELIANGEAGSASFLAEQLVDGRTKPFDLAVAPSLAADLFDFHVRNGVTKRSLGDLPGLAAAWQSLEDCAKDFNLAIPPKLEHRIDRLLGGEFDRCEVLICLCNGDLAQSNLMIGLDQTFVMDWEWAVEAPLFVDAVKLSTQIEGFAEAFLDAVRLSEAAASPALLGLADQFLLAGLLVAANRIARQNDFASLGDERAYASRLTLRLIEFIRLMDVLASHDSKPKRMRFSGISKPELADPGLWRFVH